MKIAFLLKDDVKQLVLTPETENEKHLMALFDAKQNLKVFKGSFYAQCRGGFEREFNDDHSLILYIEPDKT